MAKEAREYTLGTHDAELERLGLQHDLWAQPARDLWARSGFRAGATMLDIGCGPGFATLELAQIAGPQGRIIGVDASPRYLNHLREECRRRGVSNIELHEGDVARLPLADASVDLAYCRWVLCWVPDAEAVVRDVARVLRPGGVLAVQDYFNWTSTTLAPRSAIFDRIIRAAGLSYRMDGADPDVVARLPAMYARCGLRLRELSPLFFAVRPSEPLWQWPTTFFANYVPRLVERGLLTRDDQAAFDADWAARSRDPHTFFCTPTVYNVVGIKD